jgi:thymidylate synthase (FAD)
MRDVQPQVFLVGSSQPDYFGVLKYLYEVGGQDWMSDDVEPRPDSAQDLVEFAGRLCYRSWKPGLNPNVSKVRTDQGEYLRNILKQKHGSVLEHISYSFVFHNVSRVFTHEACRHRAGVSISQESMRFVRLDGIPFWFPDWALEDEDLIRETRAALARLEWLQGWMASHFGLDEPGVSFAEKKEKTSFMRRFAPDGVATGIMWTANVRELRHVIEARTSPGAEEEIRMVFAEVARIMQAEAPALFGDFTEHEDGSWVPEWSKV